MSKPYKQVSKAHFKVMALMFVVRDFFLPCDKVLEEVGIQPGYQVLDYGCGPGACVPATAELVGSTGNVYAMDIHPSAIHTVQGLASKKGLTNGETILSDCETGLSDNSIDVILLYDIFHYLADRDAVMNELHRVLRPEGMLSFSDHHMKMDEITAEVTSGGLFKLEEKGRKTFTFSKT